MGRFPKPGVKITKKYICPTRIRPKNDTTATDSTAGSDELKRIEVESSKPKEINIPNIF